MTTMEPMEISAFSSSSVSRSSTVFAIRMSVLQLSGPGVLHKDLIISTSIPLQSSIDAPSMDASGSAFPRYTAMVTSTAGGGGVSRDPCAIGVCPQLRACPFFVRNPVMAAVGYASESGIRLPTA